MAARSVSSTERPAVRAHAAASASAPAARATTTAPPTGARAASAGEDEAAAHRLRGGAPRAGRPLLRLRAARREFRVRTPRRLRRRARHCFCAALPDVVRLRARGADGTPRARRPGFHRGRVRQAPARRASSRQRALCGRPDRASVRAQPRQPAGEQPRPLAPRAAAAGSAVRAAAARGARHRLWARSERGRAGRACGAHPRRAPADRKGAAGRVAALIVVRAPNLYRSLRGFCLAGFSLLADDVANGAELPFAFEEHASRGRASLYEYRPLVRSYVAARAERMAALADARLALDELPREPAAAIYAAAHAGKGGDASLLRTVVLPLLADVADACGGFDWSDEAFDRCYAALEHSLLGDRRTYAAVAPLVGLSLGSQVELADGLRVRIGATGELATHWPEANGLLPAEFGHAPDRLCVLELEQTLLPNAPGPPDAPGELADAVSALRLATAAPVAAGPVLFERLDWRPLAVRPVLPIAAAEPPGEPARLDSFRARLAADLLVRLGRAEDDPELAEALDRSEQLREALVALLGGPDGLWAAAVRAAVLLGETAADRAEQLDRLRSLSRGEPVGKAAAEAVRKAVVETLAHGDRAALIESLDDALLGVRPRPAGYFAALAS